MHILNTFQEDEPSFASFPVWRELTRLNSTVSCVLFITVLFAPNLT